jgi:hypothetical protein
VGLIVLEGLIVQFMTVTGDEPYNDDSTWSAEEQTIRGYCKNIFFFYFPSLFDVTPLFFFS